MASTDATSRHADVGPIETDADTACGHDGSTFPTDPPEVLSMACEEPAAFRVELPTQEGVPLCSFHLARWTAAYRDRAALYRDQFGLELERALPEPHHQWVQLSDLPRLTHGDGEVWRRLGLDQRGNAHYHRSHPRGYRLLAFEPGWNVADLRVESEPIDAVAVTTGWAALDPEAEADLSTPGGAFQGADSDA